MRTRTRQSLRDEIREHADIVDDPSVPDSFLNLRIDQAIAELWTLLVAYDDMRFLRTGTLVATPGVSRYLLSSLQPPITDFYRMVQVEGISGQDATIIMPEQFISRARRSTGYGDIAVREAYRMVEQGLDGSAVAIEITPGPSFSTYKLYYVQSPQTFSDDDSVIDGVAGWEDFITIRVRRDVAEKREEQERYAWAQSQLLGMVQRIQSEASRTRGPHYPADIYGLRR